MRSVAAVILVVAGVALSASQSPATANLDRLRGSIEAAMPPAQGMVGVAIKHLESNISLSINGDEPFPMASTFKLPVLVELHAMARAGSLNWDDRVEITSKDQHLGSGDITPLFDPPGLAVSMRNMANLMMMISDNSAADICLAKAGAAKVTARMRGMGIDGIRVDRSCQELILDYQGRDTERLKDLARDDLREAMRRDARVPAGRRVAVRGRRSRGRRSPRYGYTQWHGDAAGEDLARAGGGPRRVRCDARAAQAMPDRHGSNSGIAARRHRGRAQDRHARRRRR